VATGTLEERIAAMRRAQLDLDLEVRRCYSVMRLVEQRCERLLDRVEKRLEALAAKESSLS
jgi:exonuclease VII small subunit